MKEITSVEEWESCLAGSAAEPVFVFKHSTRCPISAAAHDAVTRYIDKTGATGPAFHLVKVIESRPVSNAIAETLAVQHKSPQLILVKNGQAVWSASHYGITGENVAEAVKTIL